MVFPRFKVKFDIPIVAFWVPYLITTIYGYSYLLNRIFG